MTFKYYHENTLNQGLIPKLILKQKSAEELSNVNFKTPDDDQELKNKSTKFQDKFIDIIIY